MVDSGASVNILDTHTHNQLCMVNQSLKILSGTDKNIYPYGSNTPLPVIGLLKAPVSFRDTESATEFYVVNGNTGNMLSCKSAEDLGIIHFANSISEIRTQSSVHDIVSHFPNLFNGIGKIKNKTIKLHVDTSIQPRRQPHRRIPYKVRKDVEAELEKLEKFDIIEKVTGPTPWVSPIVVVPKKSGAGVRICVDMREANTAIQREKHIMPTIDDLIVDLNGATVFSKLDLTAGYHQLELSKESRNMTTFSTHAGLRRYKRLMFGVNAASEIFQNALEEILLDIPGCRNMSDDIIVYGKNQQEHDHNLKNVFVKLNECGVTLNKEKCEFSKGEISFYGHTFSKHGITADPNKIETIRCAKRPENSTQLRSFLGMTQYVARFIPSYATIIEPLRKLTHQDVEWSWGKSEQKAFDKLKDTLVGSHVMKYYDNTKATEILVDASPVGLGAILCQSGKVLNYGSRALTDVESRYSQTEREMLAVVWGVEHFHLYTYGGKFTIVTDHKPLIGIFKSLKQTSARLERWRIRIMPYDYELIYRPGKDDANPADFISRNPLKSSTEGNVAEDYANYVCANAVPKAMTLDDVQAATKSDHVMQALIKAILTNQWTNPNLDSFKRLKDEFAIANGCVMRGTRLVIPTSLHERSVDLAHIGHQGIVKTKCLLREKVWFHGIDKMVENKIECCIPCQAATTRPIRREPLKMSYLPSSPWQNLSIDFTGPFPTGEYLMVVIDDYSRYPEVEIITSTSARVVLPRLDEIFSRQGIPQSVKSDNGPPFNGKEFVDFAKHFYFRHRKITPLWPEANGEAERFMATVKKAIHAAIAEQRSWKQCLSGFLRQYRATPHSSTGVSPFEALYGRKMQIQLPQLWHRNLTNATTSQVNDETIRCKDDASKRKMKAYADKRRHTKPCDISVGDSVLVQQKKENKLTPPFNPKPYQVVMRNGSMITAQRGNHTVTRNTSHFKQIPINVESDCSDEEDENELSEEFVDLPLVDLQMSPSHSPSRPTTDDTNAAVPQQRLRTKSKRSTRPPSRYKDYVMCMDD